MIDLTDNTTSKPFKAEGMFTTVRAGKQVNSTLPQSKLHIANNF